MKRRVFDFQVLALGLGALLSSAVVAQTAPWPSKPLTLVVAYPAGGDTDALARLFAEKLTTRLQQTVIVDNKPGASGTIGSSAVSKAAADGYTLLFAPSTFTMAQLVLKVSATSQYHPVTDFTPIIEIGKQPLFLFASQQSGIKNMKDLLQQNAQNMLSYASPGHGSPMHILAEMFQKSAGIQLKHIPYKGTSPAVTDVVGGHVPLIFTTYGPMDQYVKSGKIIPLAIADSQRSSLAPQVPTLDELGILNSHVVAWQGVFAPKNLPASVTQVLNQHLDQIVQSPEVQAKMLVLGTQPVGGSPAVLQKTNENDFQKFTNIVNQYGIVPN